jgi:hypothetical protein
VSPSQFQQLLDRFDKFEERFASRLLRVELQIAALGGGLTIVGLLVGTGTIHL